MIRLNLKAIGYWTATAFVTFELLAGGLADLTHGPILLFAGDPVVPVFTQLGYPTYLLTLLGAWKLLGAAALLLPRLPRLKEWAYAGAIIALTGASFSWAASDGDTGNIVMPLIFAVLALVSWALRPPSRTLGALFPGKGR